MKSYWYRNQLLWIYNNIFEGGYQFINLSNYFRRDITFGLSNNTSFFLNNKNRKFCSKNDTWICGKTIVVAVLNHYNFSISFSLVTVARGVMFSYTIWLFLNILKGKEMSIIWKSNIKSQYKNQQPNRHKCFIEMKRKLPRLKWHIF